MSYSHPDENYLLAALPECERNRMFPHLEAVELPLGAALYNAESPGYAYFPTTFMVSILHILKDGATAEVSVVGNEGVVGVSIFLGGDSTTSRAVVASAGRGFRISANSLKVEFNRAGPTQRLLLRYCQAFITQISLTAVCNRHHTVDQQLCRWLLLSIDRLPENDLVMTQELIASMLGVRREGITESAGKLQRAGVIHYHRGRISILDRIGLEARVCECYQVIKSEFDRLLPIINAA